MRQAHIDDGVSIVSAVYTSDQNGAAVSHADCDAVRHQVNVGVSGDTLSGSVYLSLELEHSDDNSAWSDVTDSEHVIAGSNAAFVADGTGVFAIIDAAAEDPAFVTVDYVGPKAYSRVVANFVGSHSNGMPLGAAFTKGFIRKLP